MPRLTKALKEEIVKAVFKASALPARRDELNKQLSITVREALVLTLPERFLEVTKNLPSGWFQCMSNYYLHYSGNKAVPGNICIDPPISYPAHDAPQLSSETRSALLDKYNKLFQVYERDRDELNNTTWALLNSYRTTEKLLNDVPEMEKFIPKESVNYPPPAIPVSNVLAKFMQMGVALQA